MVSPRTVGLCASLILLSGSLSVLAAPLSSREPVVSANLSASKKEIIIQEYVDPIFPRRLARRIQQDLVSRLNVSPLSNGQTSWVYHLSEDGTQIAQNAAAIGAIAQVVASFDPLDDLSNSDDSLDHEQAISAKKEQQIIFQSQQSGDFERSVQTTALLADGTLYHESSFMGQAPERTVLRQLSPEEIIAFEAALQQQRFPNLNRMRYFTSAAFADYPTTRLTAPGIGVSYIDLEKESLPESLRSVISLWQLLEQTPAQ